ncbi:MAG: T9SS type A sorting domain-containing protein [Bacteroidales bacterium]|nr:T9SS type A sorting domain-containing protein [Bacteroidales bacterium]
MSIYKNAGWLIILFFIVNNLVAQDTIKVMHYNLLYYGKNTSFCTSSNNYIDDKNKNLKTIIQYVKPDIFSVNELDGEGADPVLDDATYLLDNALNVDGITHYRKTEFPDIYLANTIFYNSNKLILKSNTPIRFTYGFEKIFNVYKFYYNSEDLESTNDTAYIYCLVAHLKAGSGATEETQRAYETSLIIDYFESLGEQGNYLVLGDFNVYTPTESAFQNLIDPDNSLYTFYDPADQIGEWSSNFDYRYYHTQSTHTTGDCFSTGGMDDRFDFILTSNYIMNGTDHYKYIVDSYKTIGQDGSRFNSSLNTTSNSVVPNTVAQALYNMSDHLPVYLELEIDQNPGEPLKIIDSKIENINVFYNNPASDYLNLNVYPGFRKDVRIEIFSIQGVKLYSKQISNNITSIEEQINVSGFQNGTYVLYISDQSRLLYSSKIVIQN